MTALSEIDTPAFVVDLDVVERNCKRMTEIAQRAGVRLRPHVKTHKTVEGTRLQTAGQSDPAIVVSTMAEAELMAANGFEDILYSVPLSLFKASRVVEFCRVHPRFAVLLDHDATLDALERACRSAGSSVRIRVWLKVDAGYHRAGVPTASKGRGVALALRLSRSEHVELRGLYAHSGHTYAARSTEEVNAIQEQEAKQISEIQGELEREHGVRIDVAVGDTPSCSILSSFKHATEIHPGNYVFYDAQQASVGSCTLADCAATVLTRVLSHYPERNQLLIDAGGLALSKDAGGQNHYGVIVGHEQTLTLSKISQECGVVTATEPIAYSKLPIGSILRVIPCHSCMAAACFRQYYVVRGDSPVLDKWVPAHQW